MEQFDRIHYRLTDLENKVRRMGRTTVLATLVPWVMWALVTIYSIERGAGIPVPPAAAEEKQP